MHLYGVMSLQVKKDEEYWILLRSHLNEQGFCKATERNKVVIFLALVKRWRNRGFGGSPRDWWVWLPNGLFNGPFYRELLNEALGGRHYTALSNAFEWILQQYRPHCAGGAAWFSYVGNHKGTLLAVLGVKGKNVIHQTEWDMDALLAPKETTGAKN